MFLWAAAGAWPSGWPLQVLVPFLTYAILAWAAPPLWRTTAWLRRGTIDRRVLRLSAVAIAVPVGALAAWVAALEPDLSRWSRVLPDWNPFALAGGVVLFSIINAALEESIYRGVLLEGLGAALGRGLLPVLLQALAFGAIHYEGVPSGWVGLAMATIYGVMLGLVRTASGGLLAPILVHVVADLVIVGILVLAA